MKYIAKLLALGVMIFGFYACGSSQKLMEKLPFTHGEVRIEPWSVGESNTQKGVNIYLPVTNLNNSEVELDSVYYKGMVASLEPTKKDDYNVYIARFMESKPSNIILHADSKKEFGNTPPKAQVVPPFEINDNEALLRYTRNGKARYFKLSNLIPASAIHYRELPPSLK